MTVHFTNKHNILKYGSVSALRFTFRKMDTDTDTLQIPYFAYEHGHMSVSVLGPIVFLSSDGETMYRDSNT